MKTKGNPKKNMSPEGDRFDRNRVKKAPQKDRSSKRRLSIYDDFEDDENWEDFNYNSEEEDDIDDLED